jgi:nucleotide-binding universal stress UspA family protein
VHLTDRLVSDRPHPLPEDLSPRTVVAPYAPDAASVRAVCRAAALAGAAGARLIVVLQPVPARGRVPLEPAATPVRGAPFVPRATEPAADAAARQAAEARRLAGEDAEIVEVPEEGIDGPIRVAREAGADLLVVGAGGPSLLGRLLGPDPDDPDLAELACDLLVVHEPTGPAGGFGA